MNKLIPFVFGILTKTQDKKVSLQESTHQNGVECSGSSRIGDSQEFQENAKVLSAVNGVATPRHQTTSVREANA